MNTRMSVSLIQGLFRNLRSGWRLHLKATVLIFGLLNGRSVYSQSPGFQLERIASCELPVTGWKMTTVIFPVDIAAGIRVSRDVLVSKVKGIDNVLELKALKRGFAPTNLAVFGKDGSFYSFVLRYMDDTTMLSYKVLPDSLNAEPLVRLSDRPVGPGRLRVDAASVKGRRRVFHKSVTDDGIRLCLNGVFLQDNLLWLSLELQNLTPIDCIPLRMRFFTDDRQKVKRVATQELEVIPAYSDSLMELSGFGQKTLAVALRPLVLRRGRRLVIELTEEESGRRVLLHVSRRMLMKARRM